MPRTLIATAWAVAILATTATAVAGCDLIGKDAEGYLSGGPGEPLVDEGVSATTFVRADAGAKIAYGTPALRNAGGSPITLEEVRLVGDVPASAAEIVEVRARDYVLGDHLGASAQWPLRWYERESEVLDDYRLDPGELVNMIVVVRVKKTGVWSWPKTEFIYESEGHTYVAEADFGYDVCPTDPALSDFLDKREDGSCRS